MIYARILAIILVLLAQSSILRAQSNPFHDFDRIDRQVRDLSISREEAMAAFRKLLPEMDRYYAGQCPQAVAAPSEWVFPLEGYRPSRSIGGTKGSGYVWKGYDYFDGKRHHAHPAHDLFIRDGNQDSMDDATGKPVRVLSATAGIIAGIEAGWMEGSDLRGGLYVLVYDPPTRDLFYYAHLRSISVRLGDCVRPGQPLGEVGRTGKNAARPKSPTHLHFKQLRFDEAYPRPVNPYERLVRAIRR